MYPIACHAVHAGEVCHEGPKALPHCLSYRELHITHALYVEDLAILQPADNSALRLSRHVDTSMHTSTSSLVSIVIYLEATTDKHMLYHWTAP
jgi:hypothetical protein